MGELQHLQHARSRGGGSGRSSHSGFRVQRRIAGAVLGVHHRIMEWSDGGTPNLILDDGGDATLLALLGSRAEEDSSVLDNPSSEEERVLYAAIKTRLANKPGYYS